MVFEFYKIKIEVCDSGTKQLKYSNCTVNPSKYLGENQEI